MKNFFKQIGSTFYSSNFYQGVKAEKAGKIIAFLLKVSLLLGVFAGIIGIILFLTMSPTIKKTFLSFVDAKYPNDLVVTVKDGRMTTNTNEPFFVETPKDIQDETSPKNILAVLPNEKTDVSVLEKYDTVLAMTSDGFLGQKDKGQEIRIMSYKDMSFVADKDFIIKGIGSAYKFILTFFSIGIIPIMIVFFIINAGIHLIWLFFVALLIWGFLRLKKINVSYMESYKIGMYAIVPLMCIEIIAIPLHISGKLFTTAIVLIITLIVTHKWQKEELSKEINTTSDEVVKEVQN